MAEAASVDTVMRALADSTHPSAFERIVSCSEITGSRADPRQRCNPGRHLAAPQVIQTRRSDRRATRRAERLLPCPA